MTLSGNQLGLILADELKDFALIRPRAFEYPDEFMKAALEGLARRLSDPYAEFKDTFLYYALEHFEAHYNNGDGDETCPLCRLLIDVEVAVKVQLSELRLAGIEAASDLACKV